MARWLRQDSKRVFRAVIERDGQVLEYYGPYHRQGDAQRRVTENTTGWHARYGNTGRVQVAEVVWRDVDDDAS